MTIKAVILSGGYGTRLVPFTLTRPKPLMELANKPMLVRQIEALKIWVDEVILAVSCKQHDMEAFVKEWEKKLDIKITISKENEVLDTAGPIGLVADILKKADMFFVLNSDVICTYPFDTLLQFHNKHNAKGTILLTKVPDPSRYGVVIRDNNDRIVSFAEKPNMYVGNTINAGIYLFDKSVLSYIAAKKLSFEKQVFPAMIKDQNLFGCYDATFWMDIGKPNDFLFGTRLFLEHNNQTIDQQQRCNVVIGKDCVVEHNVVIDNSTLMDRVTIQNGCVVRNSIIGWGSVIKNHAHILNSFIGEDVTVQSEIVLDDIIVLPHKNVKDNSYSSKVIL